MIGEGSRYMKCVGSAITILLLVLLSWLSADAQQEEALDRILFLFPRLPSLRRGRSGYHRAELDNNYARVLLRQRRCWADANRGPEGGQGRLEAL